MDAKTIALCGLFLDSWALARGFGRRLALRKVFCTVERPNPDLAGAIARMEERQP
jgi:hypothetical protein